jgi:hypothetical protein
MPGGRVFYLQEVNLSRCVVPKPQELFYSGKSRYESFTKRHLFMLVAEQHSRLTGWVKLTG